MLKNSQKHLYLIAMGGQQNLQGIVIAHARLMN